MNTINPQYNQTKPSAKLPEQRSINKLAYLPHEPQTANLINAKSLDELLKMSKMEAIRWTGVNGNASGAVFHTSKGPVAVTVKHVAKSGGNPVSFFTNGIGDFSWSNQSVLNLQINAPEEVSNILGKNPENSNKVFELSDGLAFQGNYEAIRELLTSLKPLVPKDINEVRNITKNNSTRTELFTYRLNRPGTDLIRGNPQSEKLAFSDKPLTYKININSSSLDDVGGLIETSQATNQFGVDFADHGTSGSVSITKSSQTKQTLFLSFFSQGNYEKNGHELKWDGKAWHIPLTQDIIEKALIKLDSSKNHIG